ncbi:uncharacterized protein LOC108271650 [Ictalurus punctatus]|uniref:non-specific serine/threonine protein kinase n=1 Tax=Ictalurus punctatus TaxID=7998 RepID=A0A2D0RWH0_ICTPU|nr:uncharacterized protein LOC108271650 [Ictalurus punctatus]
MICPENHHGRETESNKMHKDDLIQFIQRKSQECLLHVDEPNQRESYFFWNIMDLFCKHDGNATMSEVAIVLFTGYRFLKKKASKLRGVQKQEDWCLPLARLLCAAVPDDEHRKAVIDMGDNLASKGLTYAAHLCYLVAHKESGFDLIGCESFPDRLSALTEAIERTEVYEYVMGLNSQFTESDLQELKFLDASKLFESGLSAQALDYCETIAKVVTPFPDSIANTSLDLIISRSKKLHDGKGEEPEWLLNIQLLHEEEADLSDSYIDQEQRTETPPSLEVPAAEEGYSDRAQEHKAFLTEEVTSRYYIGELLGEGGGGAVYAGVRKADNTEVAVKFIIRDEYHGMMTTPDNTSLPTEVLLMQILSKPIPNPNVLVLLEWFEIPDFFVLILERPSPCMDLQQFCDTLHNGKLSEPLARDIMLQLVKAALHCYDCGVYHTDIKTANVLINTETLQIKLIDFGSGFLLKDTPCRECPGSMNYFPPEWLQHREHFPQPATVWTLGIILYELMHGDLPFQSADEITEGCLHFTPGVSGDCCELISWCLQQDPNSRPNFREIIKHRWFKAGQSYFENFPVLGGLITPLLQFLYSYIE